MTLTQQTQEAALAYAKTQTQFHGSFMGNELSFKAGAEWAFKIMKPLIKQAFHEGAETTYANESEMLELLAFLKRHDLYSPEDEPPAPPPLSDDDLPF